jgi:hypothetical protein
MWTNERTDGQTESRHGKADTRFGNFANVPKIWLLKKGKH